MKFKISVIFSMLFVVLSVVITGCPAKSPTAPGNTATPVPTNTYTFTHTPCNWPGITCTDTETPTTTFSSTPTNTFTVTPTHTPTNTQTKTCTHTATNTQTNTGTPTETGTPTNTQTVTDTPTITNTPTVTCTSTETGTPTNTPVGDYISGSVTYTGPGTVSASHPIQVFAGNPSGSGGNNIATITSNGGGYSIQVTPGNNLVSSWYMAVATPVCCNNGNAPEQGDYVGWWDGGTSPVTINVTGNTPNTNVTIGSSHQVQGISGAVTYSGGNTVDSNHAIFVELFTNSAVTQMDKSMGPGNLELDCANATYNLGSGNNGAVEYLLVYQDNTGIGQPVANVSQIPGGDPYTIVGPVTISLSSTKDITFPAIPTPTATCVPPGSYSISGSVTYTGANTGATVYVIANTQFGGEGHCSPFMTSISGTQGSYAVTGLSPAVYYITSLYGTMSYHGPALGSYVGGYRSGGTFSCSVTGMTPVTVTSANRTGISFGFGASYQLHGVNVNLNYSGSQPNDVNAAIYSDSNYTNQIDDKDLGCCPQTATGSLTLIDNNSPCSAETVYVMAWVDNGSGGQSPQSGDAFIKYGATTTVASATAITVNFADSNIWP